MRNEIFQEARDKRNAIVRAVMSLYARHGMGLEIDLECRFGVVSVDIKDFRDGELKAKESFSIYLTEGDDESLADLAERQTKKALKNLGAEFTSIREFLENV